ncbi:MAG: hypothetical protein IJS62_07160 [Bacteroidales bacterium]|nr:hypothetical protein [Bacteroidales bacterium]MBR0299779.1 hypothetical protein [Bacteroidales bacterium]
MKGKVGKLFESRKGQMDELLHRDFINNGIATFPCKISSFYDIVNPLSIQRYETPNPDFTGYLESGAEVLPPDCPIVLNIIEDCLTEEERETIVAVIQEYYAYRLGMVEKEEKRHRKRFFIMIIGLVLSGFLLWFSQGLDDVPRELFFVLFWFMGDTICDYILLTGHDLRRDRRAAGQLASIKVTFSKSFDESDYTKEEVDKLHSEIEQDVKETIRHK